MRHWTTPLALCLMLTGAAAFSQTVVSASPTAIDETDGALTLAVLRNGLAGQWSGSLEYRDYTANEWFGIPMTVRISAVGDGVTLLRHSEFDDGPTLGIVRITTILLLDPAAGTETTGMFRRGRAAELVTYATALQGAPVDATHWTVISETTSVDDNRPARLRETMTRDGDSLTTLKEVDMLDEPGEAWLVRNRTRLTRTGD